MPPATRSRFSFFDPSGLQQLQTYVPGWFARSAWPNPAKYERTTEAPSMGLLSAKQHKYSGGDVVLAGKFSSGAARMSPGRSTSAKQVTVAPPNTRLEKRIPATGSNAKWWSGVTLPGDVDWQFLNDREEFRTIGYVPRDKYGARIGNSAVTIGAGVDLGQHSEAELRKWGVSDRMIGRLKPWLNGTRPLSEQLKDADRLQLSWDEAADLTRRSVTAGYNELAQRYNESRGRAGRFEDLPKEMQTMVLSVAHQYGPKLASRTPSFWDQVTKGRWEEAYENLLNFHDGHRSRREREAKFLKPALHKIRR